MAQTKRKTKHRGNAGGGIVTRGRTGRPLSADEKKRNDRDQRREDRLSRKPTWKSAATRAGLAGAFMFVFLLFVLHPKSGSPVLPALFEAVVAMLLYLVFGYYLESYLWRRRMAKKQTTARR